MLFFIDQSFLISILKIYIFSIIDIFVWGKSYFDLHLKIQGKNIYVPGLLDWNNK